MPKRKNEHIDSGESVRKRQAFTQPKTASLKAIIDRNSRGSPLLRLPLEIRQRIWQHTVGNRFLHVQQWKAYPHDDDYEDAVDGRRHKVIWRTNFCVEEESYREPDDEMSPLSTPHSACTGDDYSLSEELWEARLREDTTAAENDSDAVQRMLRERRIKRRPQLRLLRVCRQIYIEACPIMWATNTFSFHEANTLRAFFDNRGIAQKKLLKNLHLRMEWPETEDKAEWDKKMTLPLIKTMKGLRSLHVDLALRVWTKSGFMAFVAHRNRYFESLQRQFVDRFANWSVLRLEDVTVSITNHFDWDDRPQHRWTREGLREWSERLKTLTFGPYVKVQFEGLPD